MNNYLVMTVLGGVSGGILYFVGKELYDKKYNQKQEENQEEKQEENQVALDHKECKYKKIINPGVIVGAGIGFSKAYYDKNF